MLGINHQERNFLLCFLLRPFAKVAETTTCIPQITLSLSSAAAAECSAWKGQPGLSCSNRFYVYPQNYSLRACHEPKTDVGPAHKAVDETDKDACPHGAYILVCAVGGGRERQTVKISKRNMRHAKCK